MDYVVLSEAARPYHGRYEFSLEVNGLTTLEWGWIKKFSGYLMGTLMDGYRGGDAELFTVFAVIALHRNGVIAEAEVPDVYAKLQRLVFDETISMDSDDDTVEAGGADPQMSASSSSNGGSSVPASKTSSARSGTGPPTTGIPGSAGSVSAPVTSAA